MPNEDGCEAGLCLAAVIIPHYNDVARLGRCLEALLSQAQESMFDLVVVDNGSTEPLQSLKVAFPQVRFIVETEKGAAAARNRGVLETTAPWIFFIDADCIPAKNWLARAEDHALAECKDVDLIGGMVEVFDETAPPRSGAQAFEAVFAFDNRGYVERQGFSVTANLLTRREVFLDVGPLRAGLSEDLDWCHRARAKGYRLIYDEALRCAHPTRTDWTALKRKWQRLTEEMFAVNGRNPVARLRWAARALAMLPSVPVHAYKVMISPQLSGPQDRCRALATLLRLRLWRAWRMLGQALTGQ